MKKIYNIYLLFLLSMCWITVSCVSDFEDNNRSLSQNEGGLTVSEAKEFFENYLTSADVRSTGEQGLWMQNDFTPEWNNATAVGDNNFSSVDIPIDATVKIKAMVRFKTPKYGGYYSVFLQQKLVVVKVGEGIGAYLMTLVPDLDCMNTSIDDFLNAGDKGSFSGRAVYTELSDGSIVQLDRYKDGVKSESIYLYDSSSDMQTQYSKFVTILNDVKIQRCVKNTTRSSGSESIWDGWWWWGGSGGSGGSGGGSTGGNSGGNSGGDSGGGYDSHTCSWGWEQLMGFDVATSVQTYYLYCYCGQFYGTYYVTLKCGYCGGLLSSCGGGTNCPHHPDNLHKPSPNPGGGGGSGNGNYNPTEPRPEEPDPLEICPDCRNTVESCTCYDYEYEFNVDSYGEGATRSALSLTLGDPYQIYVTAKEVKIQRATKKKIVSDLKVDVIYYMSPALSNDWHPLGTGKGVDRFYAAGPGIYKIKAEIGYYDNKHGMANSVDVITDPFEVFFPTRNEILKNSVVKNGQSDLWKKNRFSNRDFLMEYGMVVFLNTSTTSQGTYSVTMHDGNPVSYAEYIAKNEMVTWLDLDSHDDDVYGSDYFVSGGKFFVLDMHTHPPIDLSNPNYYYTRGLGASSRDREYHAWKGDGAPRYVLDFMKSGTTGDIDKLHSTDDATLLFMKAYSYGGDRRTWRE